MADSNITKRALASALKELMEQMPFSKISVSDICERCEMNRKSFYYHFRDKYDLVNWIFDVEFFSIANTQEERRPWEFVEVLCEYFYENRSFYRRALQIEGQNSFVEHFRMLLKSALRDFLEKILTDPVYLEFQINFYTDAFLGSIERWLADKDCAKPDEFVTMLRCSVKAIAEYAVNDEELDL